MAMVRIAKLPLKRQPMRIVRSDRRDEPLWGQQNMVKDPSFLFQLNGYPKHLDLKDLAKSFVSRYRTAQRLRSRLLQLDDPHPA
jgi:hypothetical protein